MEFLWIAVGILYIIYKIGEEELNLGSGGGIGCVVMVVIPLILIMVCGKIAGDTDTGIALGFILCLLSAIFFALWVHKSNLNDKKKLEQERQEQNRIQVNSKVIEDALRESIDKLSVSPSLSESGKKKLYTALLDNRFPELFNVETVFSHLLQVNPEVMEAHLELKECGITYPNPYSYTTEEMQQWFSGSRSGKSIYFSGGFCDGDDGAMLKAELSRLGIDYTKYDVEEIERRKKAEDKRIAATLHPRTVIDVALYEEIDKFLASASVGEDCKGKLRLALRDNRFPELFNVEAVYANLVKNDAMVRSAKRDLDRLQYIYPDIPSYTHDEMQEWFETQKSEEFVTALTNLGIDYTKYDL